MSPIAGLFARAAGNVIRRREHGSPYECRLVDLRIDSGAGRKKTIKSLFGGPFAVSKKREVLDEAMRMSSQSTPHRIGSRGGKRPGANGARST